MPSPSGNTVEEDRAFVANLYNTILGHVPDAAGLDYWTQVLQSGQADRQWLTTAIERSEPEAIVTKLYKQILGRDPDPSGLAYFTEQIRSGAISRDRLQSMLANSTEALTRPPTTTPEGGEDALAYLTGVLDSYGLGGLAGWAWDQIKAGKSQVRILQDLRQTDQYKERFPAMDARRGAGLPAMTEAEYIAYESSVRQILRSNGLPAGFYDAPEDFASLITADLSPAEVNARIEQGYARVMEAAPEVRDAFANYFGASGDGALAAFFLDPDKATPLLTKMATQAEIGGAATRFGVTLDAGKAGALADIGVGAAEAQQGFTQISRMAPLFRETVSEQQDLTAEGEGVDAAFGLTGQGANQLERRRDERAAALAGGGGANISRQGVNLGSAQGG